MRRIQLYIDEELDDTLRQVSVAEGRSAAAVIRDAVRAYLERRPLPSPDDPFHPIVGLYEGGPDDSAEQHDRYLYDTDR